MYSHVEDTALENSLIPTTSTVARRLSAIQLVPSRYRLWIGAYSPEHTASCAADNANTSATADISANTQMDIQAKRLPSPLNCAASAGIVKQHGLSEIPPS